MSGMNGGRSGMDDFCKLEECRMIKRTAKGKDEYQCTRCAFRHPRVYQICPNCGRRVVDIVTPEQIRKEGDEHVRKLMGEKND